MRTIIAFIAIALLIFVQNGCTSPAAASVGHDGPIHGVAGKGSTESGVSGGVRPH